MKLFWTALILLIVQSSLNALPKYIMIIRHAEKPEEGHKLNLRGNERAEALAPFFMGNHEIIRYGSPEVIYAQRPSASYPSLRTEETVTPLANALKIPIHKEYEHQQYSQLVESVKSNPAYQGKVVLICWEHHVIPEMALLFGARDVPNKWHGDVFDRVWVIDYSDNGVIFKDLPQRLMFGDSSR